MAKKNQNAEAEVIEQTIDEKRDENSNFFDQLTAKNKDYIVRLDRKLSEMGASEKLRVNSIHHMYPAILEGQQEHIPAKKMYGTPVDRAREIIDNPEGNQEQAMYGYERSENWKLYIDGALLLGGIFAILTGISGMFAPTPQPGMGLISLILNFILGGFAVLVITKYAPQPGQSKGFIKYIVATIATMLVWILLMGLVMTFVPNSWNIALPSVVVLIIGAVSLALKWYIKKKLNIKGTLF